MPTYYPTSFFRYIRRDTGNPCMVLQQWWFTSMTPVHACVPPEADGWNGEWRDVPVVEPEQLKKDIA